jgi:hypothetical protein
MYAGCGRCLNCNRVWTTRPTGRVFRGHLDCRVGSRHAASVLGVRAHLRAADTFDGARTRLVCVGSSVIDNCRLLLVTLLTSALASDWVVATEQEAE